MKKKVNDKKRVAIYQDLPSGGALRLFQASTAALSREYNITSLNESASITRSAHLNLLQYLYLALVELKKSAKCMTNISDKCNILIVHHSWVTKAPYILRYSSIPKIYVCHEAPREFYDKEYISSFSIKEKIVNILRYPIKLVDLFNVTRSRNTTIVANSIFSSNNLKQIYKINTEVIYPGIDLSEFASLPEYSKRENVVICVGAINKLKNQQFILEAISLIKKDKRPRVILIGNGSDKAYLKTLRQYAANHEITLDVKTNVSRPELMKLYHKAKLFCYSPINEPFGIVILEALRAGLPILTSKKLGGYNEILNRDNGIITNDLNASLWAKHIETLLADREKWINISKNNYLYASRFSIEKMNAELIKLVDRVCK